MVGSSKIIPTIEFLIAHREQIIALAKKHGASNVRVFGSVARGKATPNSDIDLLIDQDWSKLSSWGGMGLQLELQDLLDCPVDVATSDELKPHIRERVLKEAIQL